MLSARGFSVVLIVLAVGCESKAKDNAPPSAASGSSGSGGSSAPTAAPSSGSNEPLLGAVPLPAADAPVWKLPCTGDFLVKAGPSTSPQDPQPSDYYRPGEPVKPKDYVSFQLVMKDGSNFPHCVITSTAYDITATGERHVLTQRDRELKEDEAKFDKSWVFRDPGQYVVEFREASTKRVLATYALTVARP
jgi:hypothetical protein